MILLGDIYKINIESKYVNIDVSPILIQIIKFDRDQLNFKIRILQQGKIKQQEIQTIFYTHLISSFKYDKEQTIKAKINSLLNG